MKFSVFLAVAMIALPNTSLAQDVQLTPEIGMARDAAYSACLVGEARKLGAATSEAASEIVTMLVGSRERCVEERGAVIDYWRKTAQGSYTGGSAIVLALQVAGDHVESLGLATAPAMREAIMSARVP